MNLVCFAIQIGTETKTNGDALEFSAVDWNSTTHFLNVKVDAGNDYVDMGTSQLLSVPYALSASSVSDLKKLNILGPADQPAARKGADPQVPVPHAS